MLRGVVGDRTVPGLVMLTPPLPPEEEGSHVPCSCYLFLLPEFQAGLGSERSPELNRSHSAGTEDGGRDL